MLYLMCGGFLLFLGYVSCKYAFEYVGALASIPLFEGVPFNFLKWLLVFFAAYCIVAGIKIIVSVFKK